jgi:hypothetical protein
VARKKTGSRAVPAPLGPLSPQYCGTMTPVKFPCVTFAAAWVSWVLMSNPTTDKASIAARAERVLIQEQLFFIGFSRVQFFSVQGIHHPSNHFQFNGGQVTIP